MRVSNLLVRTAVAAVVLALPILAHAGNPHNTPTSAPRPTATATPGGTATPTAGGTTPIQIYGTWHCGNHGCDWSVVRDTAPGGEFDVANHWIIDRGDGSGKPSVNMVVL